MGKASVLKGKVSTITFTEPEDFEGISVTSDETGNPDVFLLEFSGIPAEVPKNIASEISLLFSLFSNSISSEVSILDTDCFSESDDGTAEVIFYKITYEISNGIPISFEAGNDTMSVSIIISDFHIKNNQ